ncbi:hypothetical protein E4U42_006405 [Claviceps africana]|uniref:Secreted protein n=1 Tax=Claviceps africana TaxID=83212 RepID=A0A8K0J4F8_9HYPO|nr:hypothetical protein E4U42_006405 [Claviceps africana]
MRVSASILTVLPMALLALAGKERHFHKCKCNVWDAEPGWRDDFNLSQYTCHMSYPGRASFDVASQTCVTLAGEWFPGGQWKANCKYWAEQGYWPYKDGYVDDSAKDPLKHNDAVTGDCAVHDY